MTVDPWAFQRWAREQTLGNPTRKLMLMSLATTAESQTGYGFMSQEDLASFAECSVRTVSDHLKALEAAGVLARRYRSSPAGRRLADGFLLLAPWVESWPDGTAIEGREPPPADPASGDPAPSSPANQAAEQERPSRTSQSRQETRAGAGAKADVFPDDLPSSLTDVAIEAGKILKRTALARQQRKEVTRAAVGHAVLTFPDRDHVRVAREVEAWLLHGKGATRSCADIVARFRNFLGNSEPMAGPPLPAGVAPLHGRRGGRESAGDLISAMWEGQSNG